jgi:hypothetical protein
MVIFKLTNICAACPVIDWRSLKVKSCYQTLCHIPSVCWAIEWIGQRVPSSVMLRHVALVRTDFSEECRASIIKVTRISELGTTLATTSNQCMLQTNTYIVFLCSVHQFLVMANVPSSLILVTLMMEALRSSETSVHNRATWHNIPEDDILHSHCCKNLKSYITNWLFCRSAI